MNIRTHILGTCLIMLSTTYTLGTNPKESNVEERPYTALWKPKNAQARQQLELFINIKEKFNAAYKVHDPAAMQKTFNQFMDQPFDAIPKNIIEQETTAMLAAITNVTAQATQAERVAYQESMLKAFLHEFNKVFKAHNISSMKSLYHTLYDYDLSEIAAKKKQALQNMLTNIHESLLKEFSDQFDAYRSKKDIEGMEKVYNSLKSHKDLERDALEYELTTKRMLQEINSSKNPAQSEAETKRKQ